MNKFNEVYRRIILEQYSNTKLNKTLFNGRLLVGYLFAPKTPFEITDDMYISGAICKGEAPWAGRVKEIISDNELIYEVTGNYSERMIPSFDDNNSYKMQGYNAFRGPSTTIKYKLIPGEIYYICDKDLPAYETGKWLEITF